MNATVIDHICICSSPPILNRIATLISSTKITTFPHNFVIWVKSGRESFFTEILLCFPLNKIGKNFQSFTLCLICHTALLMGETHLTFTKMLRQRRIIKEIRVVKKALLVQEDLFHNSFTLPCGFSRNLIAREKRRLTATPLPVPHKRTYVLRIHDALSWIGRS